MSAINYQKEFCEQAEVLAVQFMLATIGLEDGQGALPINLLSCKKKIFFVRLENRKDAGYSWTRENYPPSDTRHDSRVPKYPTRFCSKIYSKKKEKSKLSQKVDNN